MTKYKPQTPLTAKILEALIKKTGFTLSTIGQEDYFECEQFIWTKPEFGVEFPTLAINVKSSDLDIAKLYWVKTTAEEAAETFEIESNIPWSAEQKLQYFIALETIVYPILEQLLEDSAGQIQLHCEKTPRNG